MNWQKHIGPGHPWLQLLLAAPEAAYDSCRAFAAAERDGCMVRVVRGKKCLTTSALFDELAAVFQFPPYFGANWDALRDCFADVNGGAEAGLILLVTDAADLLAKEKAGQLKALLRVLAEVAEEWQSPAKKPRPRLARPLHVLLQATEDTEIPLRARLAGAGKPKIALA